MPHPTGHVLIVGVDGVRYDTLRGCHTPALDRIERDGFLQPVRVNDAGPTISGPGWATVFTGVLASDHRIFDNDLSTNRLTEFPDLVHHAATVEPRLDRFVGASWAPLVSSDSGGPLFADGGFLPTGVPAHSDVGWDAADEQVTAEAERFLCSHDGSHGSLAVVYLGAPDEVCHLHGVCPLYRDSIEAADGRIGRLLASLDGRPHRADERWSVIVVTDHGHVEEGGHGGETVEERTAWIAACGADVPTDLGEVALEHADVAAHALSVLGIEPAVPAHMVGRPFGSRAGQPA